MELKVGMYVRDTRNGIINKMNEFFLNFRPQKETYDFEKASYDIIDLIEVGDYVNGKKVHDIRKENKYFVVNYEDFETFGYLFFEDIKSIVTSQQFEKISYKVD